MGAGGLMSNARTTIAGLVAAIIGAGPAVNHILTGGFGAVTQTDWALFGAVVAAFVGLFHAADKQSLPPK